MRLLLSAPFLAFIMLAATPLQDARDRQDRSALQHLVNADAAAAKARPKDADAQYLSSRSGN